MEALLTNSSASSLVALSSLVVAASFLCLFPSLVSMTRRLAWAARWHCSSPCSKAPR